MEVLELIGFPPFFFEPLATAIATTAIARIINPVIIFLPFFLIQQSFTFFVLLTEPNTYLFFFNVFSSN